MKIHVGRTFTKEEQDAIDALAARFAEGSSDLQSLSYQIEKTVRDKLLQIELRRKEVM